MDTDDEKEMLLRVIEINARQEVERIATELARAVSRDKEALLASLEFHEFMRDACEDCVEEEYPI